MDTGRLRSVRSLFSSGDFQLPVASLLLSLTTLALEFARPPVTDVPLLYSECLCWVALWLGSLLWSRWSLQATDEDGDSSDQVASSRDSLAWTILATIVARKLVEIDWALPLITPILYYLLDRVSYKALPTQESDEKEPSPKRFYHGLTRRLPYVALGLIALGSAVALAPTAVNFYSVPLGLCFIAFETRLLFAMGPAEDDGMHSSPVSVKPFAPSTSGRVAAGLLVLMLLTPAKVLPPAQLLGITAALRAVRWLSLLVMCRSASATASSTVSTFGAAIFRVSQSPNDIGAMAAAAAAVVAVVQNHIFEPRVSYRLLTTGLVVCVSLLALYSARPQFGRGPIGAVSIGSESLASARLTLTDDPTMEYSAHPIETLAIEARERYDKMLARQSKSLDEATVEYRRRYRRPPPPGFDAWYHQAAANGLQMIDEFDSVMEKLEPFWGLSPRELRHRVNMAITSQDKVRRVSIKSGQLKSAGENDLAIRLKPFVAMMPDIDLASNMLDEPRVVVPHDRLEQLSHACPNPRSNSSTLARLDYLNLGEQPIWDLLTLSCPADSPSRLRNVTTRKATELSFIRDATASKDVCDEPSYAEQHGLFLSPTSMKITTALVPIFSSGAASSFQDLLFPSGAYRPDPAELMDIVPDIPWDEKKNELFWMGSTTGGQATAANWHKMHRQRLIEMVQNADLDVPFLQASAPAPSPPKWSPTLFPLSTISPLLNVSLHDIIQCSFSACMSEKEALHVSPKTHKLAPRRSRFVLDLDGNGWSGRFYRLLRSRSTVLKMTVLREWHDDWLMPWVHYVPVSLEMGELPEVVRYLATEEGGQRIGKSVAEEGKRWVETQGREVDMGLWVWRVVLEYARLVSDERDDRGERCGGM